MKQKIDLRAKLDFTDIDLTAPDIVVNEILSQLPEQTNGIITGKIENYAGAIESYTKHGLAALSAALSYDEEIDIQEDLGIMGEKSHKFECYIFTPAYEHFKYRIFFMEYNVSHYPVKLVLEQSVSESIVPHNYDNKYICNDRKTLEELIVKILLSKRLISVMQEIIRVYQAHNPGGSSAEIGIPSDRSVESQE